MMMPMVTGVAIIISNTVMTIMTRMRCIVELPITRAGLAVA